MSRRTFTEAEKAEALALYAEVGKAEAARRTGISAGTIGAWASRTGVATDAAANIRAATEVAAAKRTYDAQEFRTQMVGRLAEVAQLAAAKELERLADGKASLHEIVGARTRAIHDLQLLTGAATGRTESVDRTPEVDAELAKVIELRRAG